MILPRRKEDNMTILDVMWCHVMVCCVFLETNTSILIQNEGLTSVIVGSGLLWVIFDVGFWSQCRVKVLDILKWIQDCHWHKSLIFAAELSVCYCSIVVVRCIGNTTACLNSYCLSSDMCKEGYEKPFLGLARLILWPVGSPKPYPSTSDLLLPWNCYLNLLHGMLVCLDQETACLNKPAFNKVCLYTLQWNISVGIEVGTAQRWVATREKMLKKLLFLPYVFGILPH